MSKGRKLHIADYTIQIRNSEGEIVETPYLVRVSLINLLFSPELKHDAYQLIKTDKVARKIEECEGDYIILTEEEWGRVITAIDSFRGYDRHALELIDRVHNAEEVDIEIREAKAVEAGGE